MNAEKAVARRVRRHVGAKRHVFFAVVQPGFEETAREEMLELGIHVSGLCEGGMEFSGRLEECYRANLCARTPARVLMRLCRFRVRGFSRLGAKAAGFPWELYLRNGTRLLIKSASRHSRLYHTGRIGEEIAAGISKRLKDCGLAACFVSRKKPDAPSQLILARLEDDVCELSLDASGEPLYRRGYKSRVTEAPLRETLAASLLRAARFALYDMLIDPMCGSGSFSIEAALASQGRLAGERRSFAFEAWPSFRPAAYRHLVMKLKEGASTRELLVHCSDRDGRAVETARANSGEAGVLDIVRPIEMDFFKEGIPIPAGKRALIMLNPPYGKRIGEAARAKALYRRIGRALREGYSGCGWCVIVPGLELEKALALPYDRKILFMNGGVRGAAPIKDG
jgi:putative N6-adenine-specific DNA methylase